MTAVIGIFGMMGVGMAAAAQESPGYLGVVVDDRPAAVEGVAVLEVRPGSPVEAGGLRTGDRIVAVDGRQTLNIDDFSEAAERLRAGEGVPLEVLRDGVRYEFTVMPAARGAAEAHSAPAATPAVSPGGRPLLGLSVATMRSRNYGLFGRGADWGVVVEDVIPGSPAERHGVPRGAVIIALNGVRVDRVGELMTMMGRLDPSRPVDLAFTLGGRTYRQLIPLETQAQRHIEAELPPAVHELPAPPELGDLIRGADPKPEGELRLPPLEHVEGSPADPPAAEADRAADRLEAMQRELEELRRRASALERTLEKLRE